MKVLPSASVSQPFYTEILNQSLRKKDLQCFKNRLNAVSSFLSDGNTTPRASKLPVQDFCSFNINALPLQGRETFDKLVF